MLKKLLGIFKVSRAENTTEEQFTYTLEKPFLNDPPVSASMVVSYSLNSEEKRQLKEIGKAFDKNCALENIEKGVVYQFAIEILNQKNLNSRLNDLKKLHQMYLPQHGEKLEYINFWISDTLVVGGDLKNAVLCFPRPKIGRRNAIATDSILSLKVALEMDLEAKDVVSLLGSGLPKWGKENPEYFIKCVEEELSEMRKSRQNSFLKEWTHGAWSGAYQVYKGGIHSNEVAHVKLFGFSGRPNVEGFIKALSKEARTKGKSAELK